MKHDREIKVRLTEAQWQTVLWLAKLADVPPAVLLRSMAMRYALQLAGGQPTKAGLVAEGAIRA